MDNFYNQDVKEQFIDGNNFSEHQIKTLKILFNKTKSYEESIKKDIFEMNFDECENLLYFLECRSVQYLRMSISNLKRYVSWRSSQNFTLGKNLSFYKFSDQYKLGKFISKEATKKQIVTKQQLNIYSNKLCEQKDFQGALVINLLFLGVAINSQDDKCELRNIKTSDVDFDNNVITTPNRIIAMNTAFCKLVLSAINQESMVNLFLQNEGEVPERPKLYIFNNLEYLIRSRKNNAATSEPTNYFTVSKKIREISSYVVNPYINPTYLNISGMIDFIKSNYSEDYYNCYEVYEHVIEEFRLTTSKESLKSRLLPFLK